jgi:hypothetical protein
MSMSFFLCFLVLIAVLIPFIINSFREVMLPFIKAVDWMVVSVYGRNSYSHRDTFLYFILQKFFGISFTIYCLVFLYFLYLVVEGSYSCGDIRIAEESERWKRFCEPSALDGINAFFGRVILFGLICYLILLLIRSFRHGE